MGWTSIDLHRARMTLDEAKRHHLASVADYGNTKAELLAHEWHKETLFALVRVHYRDHAPLTFLRIDLLEMSAARFAYKDGSEEMGMYNADEPSDELKALIHQHIPRAKGFAKAWRDRNGVKYDSHDHLEEA